MTTQWPWMSILTLRLIFEEWYGPLLDHYGIHVRYLRYHPFFKYFADHFQRNIWRRSFKKVPFYEKRPRETPRAPNVSLRAHFLENLGKVQVKLTFLHLRGFRNLFLNLYKRNRLFLPPGGGILPCTGWLRPKGVSIFGLQVYERVGNLSFRSVKRPKRAKRCILWLWKSRENDVVLWFIHIHTVYLQQLNGM